MRQKGAMIFWGVVIVIGIIVASIFGIRSIIRANTACAIQERPECLPQAGLLALPAPRDREGQLSPVKTGARLFLSMSRTTRSTTFISIFRMSYGRRNPMRSPRWRC